MRRPKLELVASAPADLDFSHVDRASAPAKLRAALQAVNVAVPFRARTMASALSNRAFVVTDALRALVSWHSRQEDDNPDGLSSIVVLAGPPGTGKTTAVAWYAMNRLVHDVAAETEFHWYTAPELARMKRTGPERDAVVRSASEIIVVDDLGAEHVSGTRADDWRADVDELVDAIYRSTCGLALITTNLTGREFRKRYGGRVADRLHECGTWIPVVGESMRGAT